MKVVTDTERERIAALNAKFEDWRGYCRVCGKQREGTLAQLKQPCGCNGEQSKPDTQPSEAH